jgi:hypothetical protein
MSHLTDHLSDHGLMLLHQMYSLACRKLASSDDIIVYRIKARIYYKQLLKRIPDSHVVKISDLIQSLPDTGIARKKIG